MDPVTKLERDAAQYDREGTEQAAGELVAHVRREGPWADGDSRACT